MSVLNTPALQDFLKKHLNHASGPRVAVFDCDGTMIKGDIGEAMLYHQIEHFHFRRSPANVWEDHPERGTLDALFQHLARLSAEERRKDSAFEQFAKAVLSWYFGQIADGKVEKACTDIVRLFTGYTLPEVREIAEATFRSESTAPLAERTLGGYTRPRGIRYIAETLDVFRALQHSGFSLWVVSGSNQWSVESVFRRLALPLDHVIGIDLEVHNGLLTAAAVEPVPIHKKKIEALRARETAEPLLIASDSRLDLPLLQYSADIKLFINSRRKTSAEFFELTGVARDDRWVVVEHPTLLDHV